MKLKKFRVKNFRSINDSGDILVNNLTALLGRNESGKSNLLRALQSLNPAEGFKALVPIKDFPRQRRLEECNEHTPVVTSLWDLDDQEQKQLVDTLPRAKGVTQVTVDRFYSGKFRTIGFVDLKSQGLEEVQIKVLANEVVLAVQALAVPLIETKKEPLERAAETFKHATSKLDDQIQWAQGISITCQALRKALAVAGVTLDEKQLKPLVELEGCSEVVATDEEKVAKAQSLINEKLPVFMYLDEYPELAGHQDIAAFLERKRLEKLSLSDGNFEKLCKVAGLNPQSLQDLSKEDRSETRNQLVNRASAVVTAEIKRLWKDRPLKIRFNIDAQHMDTFISDPNSIYDVEIGLDDRSRGFQWFFAFYIVFSADTQGGIAKEAILLLDEPGLYLHAKSQADLLTHFERDFKNQIIFSTHSPFMVPTHKLDSVRTVNISEESGTTVTNDPTGDSRTLFPLQAALGYNIAQSLFIGPDNLVVEGVTDYWFISTISNYFKDQGMGSLNPNLVITPAGGAQKVSYMVALLSSEKLGVLVLLDREREAASTRDELVKTKLLAEKNIVFVTEAFESGGPEEADIEDLLDPTVYDGLVRASYAKELHGKDLNLNPHVPRIAKRYETAFRDAGLEFHKTRPARAFLDGMAQNPSKVMTEICTKRFVRLFQIINERVRK